MKKEQLKPYMIAQDLRLAAESGDMALMRECLIIAAEWLEEESEDLAKLDGSVTHHALMGRITPGCVPNFNIRQNTDDGWLDVSWPQG